MSCSAPPPPGDPPRAVQPGNGTLRDAVSARYGKLAGVVANLSCGGALEVEAPRAGEVVVDLGCGRGREVTRAAALVGPGLGGA